MSYNQYMDDYNPYGGWETLDTASLLDRRYENTTMSNVGPYTVPLGDTPLRREVPVGGPKDWPQCHGDKFCTLGDETSSVDWSRWQDPQAFRMW